MNLFRVKNYRNESPRTTQRVLEEDPNLDKKLLNAVPNQKHQTTPRCSVYTLSSGAIFPHMVVKDKPPNFNSLIETTDQVEGPLVDQCPIDWNVDLHLQYFAGVSGNATTL